MAGSSLAGRIISRSAVAIALILAALPVCAEFWEAPDTVSEGRYPSFFAAKSGPVLIWQESQSSGESGSARIRFARFQDGSWIPGEVSGSSYSFDSIGPPPILYSATQSRSGTIAVAISASATSIEVFLSRDGGATFEAAGKIEAQRTSVAPRIFPSAAGGWIVFATQGRQSAGTSSDNGPASATAVANAATVANATTVASVPAQPSSVSIYVTRSADGSAWSAFEPLVSDDEGLLMNFAPFSSNLGDRDIAVFQSFILGEGNLSSRYALMSKTSSDGGATWTKAKALTDFPDPSGGSEAGAQYYDNEAAQLVPFGGKLYLAWERRKAKSTLTQVWAARIDATGSLDPKTAAAVAVEPSSFKLSQLTEIGGAPTLLALEDKLKANRVLLSSAKGGSWASEDADLAVKSDPSGSGLVNFARAIQDGGRTYVAWEVDSGDRSRILAMVPVLGSPPPTLVPLNFAVGKRARPVAVQVRVDMPKDAAGLKGYAYLWKKTRGEASAASAAKESPSLSELWKSGVKKDASDTSLSLEATEDGNWTLWASVEDNAGNRSPPARISYYRKRIPPPAPIVMSPDTDEQGFLASNSFTIRWIPPEADDLAGYTWDLAYAGPLEGGSGPLASAVSSGKAAGPALPGLTAYESGLVRSLGIRMPPPGLLGTGNSYSAGNVENGYYVFSVSAIDTTGNISGVASILLKADKFKPYTVVTLAQPGRDELDRRVLRLFGRGFLADGRIERIAFSRDGREPYAVDLSLAKGDYGIASDREIAGIAVGDVEAGSYRIGLYHSTRGWYWTGPLLAVDASGTIKYGVSASYQPSFRLFSGRSHIFTIYDVFVLMAIAFAAVGILLSSRQIIAVAQEGEALRRDAIALVTGGPMLKTAKGKTARSLRRRGVGLRVKFTLTIAFLVIFVVLMLAIFLGYNMIIRTSSDLAMGLDQRARVLLESVAQGGRFFLGKEDAVTQLSLFPAQAKAMQGANYITITGLGADPKVASGEVVYATNDDAIASKLDPSTLNASEAVVLGQSAFKAAGGSDPLARLVPDKAKALQDEAATAIDKELKLKRDLGAEKGGLKGDAAGNRRKSEINAQLDAADLRIRDELRALSDRNVGSLPPFDPATLSARSSNYLFYKPILEYRPSDGILYRGMVRLEVNTKEISADVRAATGQLVRLTLIIAAIALGAGILGAFILSTVIVVPIRKLVAQIERIRDTEDKESLEGSKIEVASRDELYTLADTVNQMTAGLVKAAKDSKELIVGKGIQKMFIPLDAAPGSRVKLSTGKRDEKDFEIFGYYEGAKGVSGDYWDFRSINSRYHYFIKCDISGKGVSAALIMVQVATMVINYFNDWKKAMPKTIDLTDLTYKINDFLEERQFVGRFAAFTLGVWDSQAGVAYLCEAGDRKLHVWEDKARRLVEEMLPDSPAAGPLASFMVQMKKPFIQVTRALDHGDALMLFTDGIEEAKRHFRDRDYKIVECADAEKDKPHENHSGGQDNEEFGYERIMAILEAVASRGSYRLEKHHDPAAGELLSFDFRSCGDSLHEKILALVSIEKVFRLYRDPSATSKDTVLVDQQVDAFLEKHFDQYRLFCLDKTPYADAENPGYLLYRGVREDSQYDDLTLLAIRRK